MTTVDRPRGWLPTTTGVDDAGGRVQTSPLEASPSRTGSVREGVMTVGWDRYCPITTGSLQMAADCWP
jgi:hypothetical protein